jgi:hypothetical protein
MNKYKKLRVISYHKSLLGIYENILLMDKYENLMINLRVHGKYERI